MIIQITILIVVIVGAVHVVHEKGKKAGIEKGRMKILEENIKRANKDSDFADMVDNAIKEY